MHKIIGIGGRLMQRKRGILNGFSYIYRNFAGRCAIRQTAKILKTMVTRAEPLAKFLYPEDKAENRYKNEVIRDFWVCVVSRECSILARREVLTGKANFAITGEGKEVPQVVLARYFQKGDFRAGYYRDQAWMFALGICDVQDFFAHLYGDPEHDPFSGGRQFNNHFATPFIDADGNWLPLAERYNISSDVSCIAGQMGRGLGFALASKKFRNCPELHQFSELSNNGNEVSFITSGDAGLAEGAFWETLNAACVMQVPAAFSIWDDGYGISVPIEYQIAKADISKITQGFKATKTEKGLYIYTAYAWDYPGLIKTYEKGIALVRKEHAPALFHIKECTQPLGHSTSGSHERYKSPERLKWEEEKDGIRHMGAWMVQTGILTEEQIEALREEAKTYVRSEKDKAWKRYIRYGKDLKDQLASIYSDILSRHGSDSYIQELAAKLRSLNPPFWYEVLSNARRLAYAIKDLDDEASARLDALINQSIDRGKKSYNTYLYSESPKSPLHVQAVPAQYAPDAEEVPGYQILNAFFKIAFERDPKLFAFGEDVGKIGDVNQGMAGLQQLFGEERVFDTGIREWTIVGQGQGMAMRGLRPIAEIQYLDYLPYAFSPLTDDVATLRWRSRNQQQTPVIIRTRGHRLVGIWHAGSPIGMLANSMRGIHVCVPRNCTQAAGMYNTLLQGDDPAIVVEVLNGYRVREKMPSNLGEFTVPLGVPEVLRPGTDITLVTYGAMVRICQEACQLLERMGIDVELIDIQTILPFDIHGVILESLKKTGKILFADEDVPGGATAFMMQQVIERQGGFEWLDYPPQTLTAQPHRPAYSKDGEYFSKPSVEDVVEKVYSIVHEKPWSAKPDYSFEHSLN